MQHFWYLYQKQTWIWSIPVWLWAFNRTNWERRRIWKNIASKRRSELPENLMTLPRMFGITSKSFKSEWKFKIVPLEKAYFCSERLQQLLFLNLSATSAHQTILELKPWRKHAELTSREYKDAISSLVKEPPVLYSHKSLPGRITS